MSKIKKSLTVFLLILCLVFTGTIFTTQSAFAIDENTQNQEFALLEGASIRLNADHYGIRYTAVVGKEVMPDVQYKMMIIPSSYLTEFDSAIQQNNNDYYTAISQALLEKYGENYYLAVMNCTPTLNEDGNYYIKGSLTNIKYGNINRSFDAFAFYTDTQGNNVYASKVDNTRDIVDIASKALNSGNYVSSSEEYNILNRIITNGVNAFNKVDIAQKDDPINLQLSLNKADININKIGSTDTLTVQGLPDIHIDVKWSSDNDKVVAVNNGKLSIIGQGAATVSAKVLNKDYTCTVNVDYNIIDKPQYTFTLDSSLDSVEASLNQEVNVNDVISIIDEQTGKNIYNSVNSDKIVFDKAQLQVGERNFLIEKADSYLRVPVIVATKLLNNKTDFDWFMKMLGDTASGLPAGKDTKFATGEYYLLTANIDSARTQYRPWDQRGNFDGVFNGGGHTIANMDMPRQGFIRICTGEIKNVSFLNATYNKGNNAALVCNEIQGNGLIENVFIHGKVTNNHSGSFGSLVNHCAKGGTLRNSIAVVDFSKVTGDKGSIFTTVRGNITNCFAVSESPASYSNDGTVTNCKSYLTTGAMIADIKANPTLLDTFDNEIWNKASSIPVMPSLIESCVIKNDISENVIPKNSELVLTNELDPLINYSLASPVNGVVIEDNVLKVNNDATVGDQIIINTKFMFDESKLVSHTLTIRPTIADHSDKGSIADLVENGGIGADCVISIATINDTIGNGTITNSDIKKVYLNGAEISPTITENNITFTKSIVPNDINGYTTLEIETAEYLHRFKVMIVHGALGTVADVTQFFGIFDPKGSTKSYYVGETIILTADIDCAPEFYKAQYNQQSGHAEFCGTFDGRGHALKNMVLGDNNQRRALFRVVQTGATIKNLALINAKIGYSGAWYASSIVSELYGTVSNCFVSSNNQTKKINENANVATGIVNQINNQSVVENCIAVAEFSGTAEHKSLIVGDFRTDRTGKRFANCYGISKTTNQMVGNPGKFKTSNLQAFADAAAFGAKVTETQGLEGTGWSEYWQIKDNALYFGANKVVDWAVQA